MARDTTVTAAAPLVVIVGPTASGKTGLAVDLAERFNGEIICADSRTIYRDMDIGTAKPTLEERGRVPHWGLDMVSPGEHFGAADFKKYADQKIVEIRERGRIPFLVGGTGLYVDAVIFDYDFGRATDKNFREHLSTFSLEELHKYCEENNIDLPENAKNKRYVIRAIEQKDISPRGRNEPINTSIIVGISTDKVVLRTRIDNRIEQLFDDGVVKEATMLGKKYGWKNEAMTGNIYPLIHDYLDGKMDLDELKEKAKTRDWRLAKRQLTWLRRDPYIKWCALKEAKEYLSEILAKV